MLPCARRIHSESYSASKVASTKLRKLNWRAYGHRLWTQSKIPMEIRSTVAEPTVKAVWLKDASIQTVTKHKVARILELLVASGMDISSTHNHQTARNLTGRPS